MSAARMRGLSSKIVWRKRNYKYYISESSTAFKCVDSELSHALPFNPIWLHLQEHELGEAHTSTVVKGLPASVCFAQLHVDGKLVSAVSSVASSEDKQLAQAAQFFGHTEPNTLCEL